MTEPIGSRVIDLVALMDRLRSPGGCPWDARQTNESLVEYLVEESYETVDLDEVLLSTAKDYLVENLKVDVLYAEGKAVEVEIPPSVIMKVVESPEGLRGDTASNVQKPATLESGLVVNVPLFIKEGELVKIDTRTGAYMGRA